MVYELPREDVKDGESKAVYNQPAGHLDAGESLAAAAERETLEETAWDVSASHHLGMYRYIAPNGISYLRYGFVAQANKHYPERILDKVIIDAVWMSYKEICQNSERMRSPMVKQLINDYQSKKLYSLAVIHTGMMYAVVADANPVRTTKTSVASSLTRHQRRAIIVAIHETSGLEYAFFKPAICHTYLLCSLLIPVLL
ncbi:MAG: ADP-ribose pyrophosphatase YjhB (NUDIX family) [Cellvibrionaceae bacterium]